MIVRAREREREKERKGKNITYIAVTLEKPGIKRRRGKASWALVIDD